MSGHLAALLACALAGLAVALAVPAPLRRSDHVFRRPSARRGAVRRPAPREGPRRDRPLPGGDGPVTLVVDLVAAAVDAGVPPAAGLRAVADGLDRTGAPPDVADALRRIADGAPAGLPELAGLQAVLERSSRTGLAPSALLRRGAADARRDAQTRTAEAVGRLPVLMVLPAGLCLLPAALLLGVVPVVLDLVGQVLA